MRPREPADPKNPGFSKKCSIKGVGISGLHSQGLTSNFQPEKTPGSDPGKNFCAAVPLQIL